MSFAATTYKDEDLVKGCIAQNARYQKALYDKFYRKMYGVCLRYATHKEDAADMLQEGFIRVFRYIQDFKGGSLEGWVRRVVVNAALAHYNKYLKQHFSDVDDVVGVEVNDNTLEKMSADEIMKLIQKLPVGCRTVFNLYEIEGYSHQEIADMMQISVGTSKSQLSRAKVILREMIENLHAKSYAAF